MPGPSMDLYAPPAPKKSPFVTPCRGEISTNDALFQEEAATAVSAAASQSELNFCEMLAFFSQPPCYPGRWNLSELNLSESTFWPNRNLSEWNLSEGIFQKIFLAKPESFRMESFGRNLTEGIIQKRLFEPTIGS
jgi:hypothetical protein